MSAKVYDIFDLKVARIMRALQYDPSFKGRPEKLIRHAAEEIARQAIPNYRKNLV